MGEVLTQTADRAPVPEPLPALPSEPIRVGGSRKWHGCASCSGDVYCHVLPSKPISTSTFITFFFIVRLGCLTGLLLLPLLLLSLTLFFFFEIVFLPVVQAELELKLVGTNRRENKQALPSFLSHRGIGSHLGIPLFEFPRVLAKKGFRGYLKPSWFWVSESCNVRGGRSLSPFSCQTWRQRLRVTYTRSKTCFDNTHPCAQVLMLLQDLIS